MKVLGVLPARWASTRLPGKVLVDIAGKPMLQRVFENIKQSQELDEIIIACDEPHVLEACQAFGAKAVLTSKDHQSGSDRVAEVALTSDADIVLNIQADEPLMNAQVIDNLIKALKDDPEAVVATPIKSISSKEEFEDPNVVKVVLGEASQALYFSRLPIPYRRDGKPDSYKGCFKHLGIYAYRRDFLLQYCQWAPSFLEKEEKLEQLRILEKGFRMCCIETDCEMIGVDSPEDVQKVEAYLAKDWA